MYNIILEPYAMKVARTVLGGGKAERPYLSQQTLCSFTVTSSEYARILYE